MCDDPPVPRRVEVKVENDYLEALTRSRPLVGVAELVWNGVDAEAQSVRVKLIRNELEGVGSVEVIDDGHGMTPDEAAEAFEHLGGSWKRTTTHSKNRSRLLHGRSGQGRFRAFGIGAYIRWVTVSATADGNQETTITGTGSALREFSLDDARPTDDAPGTRVIIENIYPEAASSLLNESAIDWLTKQFALWIERYPSLSIVFHGTRVDPAPLQVNRENYALTVPLVGEPIDLEVIEWARDFGRELLLCDEHGIALWATNAGIQAPGFHFTAYIKWAGFRHQEADLPLVDGDLNPFGEILDAAHNTLREHFQRRGAELRETVVEKWKSEQVYPYEGEAATPLERAEREIFDTVATTASEAVNASEKVGKRFSLRLLREAIEQRPSALRRVLQEVLDLSDEKIADLDIVLRRTTLSALISLGKIVTDRLETIEGLHLLLFEPETRRALLERQQLHEILAAEPWIFGEEWALALSERQLTSVLREHLRLIGREDFVDAPVQLADGTTQARTDMMFSAATEMPTQERRHLVVELKRPSATLGLNEYSQIVGYADAVVSDPRFDTIDVSWSFWLVGNEIDRPLRGQISQQHLPPGLASRGEHGRYEVWVKTWAELLDGCRHRLKFLRKELDYQSTDESALEQLRRIHSHLLPQVTRERQELESVKPEVSSARAATTLRSDEPLRAD